MTADFDSNLALIADAFLKSGRRAAEDDVMRTMATAIADHFTAQPEAFFHDPYRVAFSMFLLGFMACEDRWAEREW